MRALHASAAIARGDLELDVTLRVEPGATLALLGPNGSGKSTLLRCLAGLLPLDRGRVTCGDEVWDDVEAEVHVLARRRRIGFVFQDLALFPTMTVIDNVAYGSGSDPVAVLARLGIEHLARRRPGELSGGEAQLVALARALATEPDVLMLDEPLSALDVRNRAATRRVLRGVLRDFAGIRILVTHDPLEAAALADEVAILEAGRLVHRGAMADIGARPRSGFAASLAGVNLFRGSLRSEERGIVLEVAGPSPGAGSSQLVVATELEPGTEVLATVHPHAISLGTRPPGGSVRNSLPAVVEEVDRWGGTVRVRLGSAPPLTAEVTEAAARDLGLEPGLELWASLKATEIDVYPA